MYSVWVHGVHCLHKKSLGVRLSVYPVKGYSITIPVEKAHTPPRTGGLHEEDLLGFSPMGDHFRVSSVSEFCGYDLGHTPEDFEHILQNRKKLFRMQEITIKWNSGRAYVR